MKRLKNFIALIAALLTVAAACGGAFLYIHNNRATPAQGYTAEDFGIATYISTRDADSDGVDDQTDILEGARAYIATNPSYKSAYYQGGWPDDGHGVCTDVIAYALLDAGYNLQEFVDGDIRSAPSEYGVDTPDANIDYRRVRNLRVFFNRNATSLTLDPSEIAEWQGGDIVCYEDHIGIVSDVRNSAGVPFIIHHRSLLQTRFEEDALERCGTITGHWRIGEDFPSQG